jgi:hypothetical protein
MIQPKEKQLLLDYLDEVITTESSKLVGKTLKRFEIIENRDILKRDIKELIYESFRDMRDLFIAYGHGLEQTSFKFVSKPE